MAKPLTRLLALKERLRDAAQMGLRDTQSQLQQVAAALAQGTGAVADSIHVATELASQQALREMAIAHEEALRLRLAEQTHALGQAKRELRQIEMLVEKQQALAAAKTTRRESADVDDWYRAQQSQEK